MQVTNDKVVNFHYSIQDTDGAQLESSSDKVPIAYLHGHGNILRGLEDSITGMSKGETKTVTLPPEQAYGPKQDNAEQKVPIKHLVGKYKRLLPGMIVRLNTEKGVREVSVVKVGLKMVTVDTNHPFAGKTLIFDIEVSDLREATDEEIAHGHAHGVGGHQH